MDKRITLLLFTGLLCLTSAGQVTGVILRVNVPQPDTLNRPVYIAGNFNHWYAGDSLFKMDKMGDGIYQLVLPVYKGKIYEYKYTRGNWDRVELALNDSNVKNRRLLATENLFINDTVIKWKAPAIKNEPAARAAAINARLDTLKAQLPEKMEQVNRVLKRYMMNMLSSQPKKSLHRKLDRKAAREVGKLYKKITGLVWDVMTALSPEEKQKLRDFLSKPDAQKDFMKAFGKVLDGSAG